MKIPDNTANVGAYYGNEETGQWQANGIVMEGGIVGAGDAAAMYPAHIPRQHIPGYMVSGGYYHGYPAVAPGPDDFADYMWMENEEEFDKQVMQQLEEEALMEQCIEAMLEDEQRERQRLNGHNQNTANHRGVSLEEAVSRSTLNPLAAEFVPSFVPRPQTTEEKQESPPEVSPSEKNTEEPQREDTNTHKEDAESITEECKTPEASAAGIRPTPARVKDGRKTNKQTPEVKKLKPQTAKSECKLQTPKKKEVKDVRTVKSELSVQVEDAKEICQDTEKFHLNTPEESLVPKPINYAMAARANKPKKAAPLAPLAPPAPPATIADKLSPSLPLKTDKKVDRKEKPLQRKTSAK